MIPTHMFWAYGGFSKMEMICANSFIANSYDLHIWTYGDSTSFPYKAKIMNARDILPESKIFLNRMGSYAGFSDLFRYSVLNKIGGLYADTDVVALKHASLLPTDKFLVTESTQKNSLQINGNVIHNPHPCSGNIIDLAEVFADRFNKNDITWSEIGPALLTAIVKIYPKHGFNIFPPEFANPINYWNCPEHLISPMNFSIKENTFFVHMYNEMWRRANVDKNFSFDNNSFYEKINVMYKMI